MRNRKWRRRDRRASATVELAICLPVFVTIVFGCIEACTMIYLYQSLEITAYESVRLAVRTSAYKRDPGEPNVMTNDQVIEHGNEVLSQRGVVGGTVEVSEDVSLAAQGTPITVTVRAPTGSNSVVTPAWFWDDVVLEARGTMVKE